LGQCHQEFASVAECPDCGEKAFRLVIQQDVNYRPAKNRSEASTPPDLDPSRNTSRSPWP
jgi:hypothetical protein